MAHLQWDLPPCAVDCITQAVSTTNCSIFDLACICDHTLVWGEAYVCFDKQCTNFEKLVIGQAGVKACNLPIRDRSSSYDIIIATLSALALCLVIIRIYVRWSGQHSIKLGWDDAMVVICWITAIPITVVAGYLTEIGIGRDIWDYPLQRLDDFHLFFFYIEDISYTLETGLVKIAVLAFFIRVFPSKRFRRICWWMIGLVIAFTTAFTVVSIAPCTPISYTWTSWDGQSRGRCINIQAATMVQAALNLVLEIILVALPMPTLYKLKTTLRKKLQILVPFSLGMIVVVICVLRIAALVQDYGTANMTWHAWEEGLWDAGEVYVSIVCVCLPGAKVFCEKVGKWWERQGWGRKFGMASRAGRGVEDVERGGGGKEGRGGWRGAIRLGRWRRTRGGNERLPSITQNTIMKRTSTTISWSHYDGSTAVARSFDHNAGGATHAGRLPDWAAGWESGEVARAHKTRVTAGPELGTGRRTWFGSDTGAESWSTK